MIFIVICIKLDSQMDHFGHPLQ